MSSNNDISPASARHGDKKSVPEGSKLTGQFVSPRKFSTLKSIILLYNALSLDTFAYSIMRENENAVLECVPGLSGAESLSKNKIVLSLRRSTSGFILIAQICALS